MSKRIRRRFTEEFKVRAVAMVLEQDQSVTRVCTDLDLVDSALRRWIDETKGVATFSSLVKVSTLFCRQIVLGCGRMQGSFGPSRQANGASVMTCRQTTHRFIVDRLS